jgi:serine protease Do
MIKSILPLFILVFLSSCASIFNSSSQKITINTKSPAASVYIDGKLIGKGESVSTTLTKVKKAKALKIVEEGYKDANIALLAYKRPNVYWLNFLSFPWLGIGFGVDYGVKSFNYANPIEIDKRTPVVTKQPTQKYLYLTKSSFDVPKEKLNFSYVKFRDYIKNKRSPGNSSYSYISKEKLVIDNTIFSDDMNAMLKKNGFVDTTGTLLKSQTNTLYVKVTVDSLTIKHVAGKTNYANFIFSELGLTWEIQDIYQQTKYKLKTTSVSDEYISNYFIFYSTQSDDEKNAEKLSISDALQKSFYELLAKSEVQALLSPSTQLEGKLETLKITMPSTKPTDLETAIKATVTIVTDDGHGSGFFVSNDGYIATNFHVVANSKKITIHLNNGKKIEAKLLRKSEDADLALLKIDEKVDFAFAIPTELNFKIGDEAYAIGTPKSIELGQTLTKGIISGKRTKDTQELIQTDVSINSGNSGGALVTKEGKLVGVVNAKLMGFGVEGIAFGIIAKDVIKYLNLTY